MIDRITLAANIMCAHMANGYTCGFEECMRAADAFLAYAAKPEPAKPCEHRWLRPDFKGPVSEYKCSKCGIFRSVADIAKEEEKEEEEEPAKPCEHTFRGLSSLDGKYCIQCGVKEEPAKAKRAREFLIASNNLTMICHEWFGQGTIPGDYILCREILDTEEG